MKKMLLVVGGMILSTTMFSQTNQISNTGNIGTWNYKSNKKFRSKWTNQTLWYCRNGEGFIKKTRRAYIIYDPNEGIKRQATERGRCS